MPIDVSLLRSFIGLPGLSKLMHRADRGPEIRRVLGCGQFPFVFSQDPEFSLPIPRRIDLRFAVFLRRERLVSTELLELFDEQQCAHVARGEPPCIGFALGTKRREDRATMWYIFTMQSSFAFSPHARLRRMIRGWRKVLFVCIADEAYQRSVDGVFLVPSDEVHRTAFLGWPKERRRVPPSWRGIYDRTAVEFGMPRARVATPLNIQALFRRQACFCREFFYLDLKSLRLQRSLASHRHKPAVLSNGPD